MVTLAFLIAACLDPVQAGLVLALVVAYRGPLPTVVAGVAGALIAETVMALGAAGYVWGELFAPRLVAALLQASVSAFLVWMARAAFRRAWAALVADEGADDGAAALAASGPGTMPPRLALWHMRAYARLNTPGLHIKKNAAFDCESR